MNFLYPAFLLGALAIAVPLVLHLLRRDVAPEVPFSAVRLLRQSPIEQSRRRRLRDLLLLLARAAALLLLAAAFARPYVSGGAATAGLHIIAIDRSFSMGAPGRFARAQDLARAAVREAGMKDRVAVIGFDDRADVVAAAGSRSDAQAAIDALASGFGTTRYAPLMSKAVEIADGAPARLVVITDLQRTGWEDEQQVVVPSALQVDVRDVGDLPANLAVVGVRVEEGRAVATLRNTGAARSGVVRAAVDGTSASEVRFTAGAGATTEAVVPLRTASGVLTVSIEDPGGVPADDSRHVILDRPTRPRVLLVTSGGGSGFYLSRALAVAAAEDDGFETKIVEGTALAAMPEGELSAHAAVVLLSTRGLDRRGRDVLGGFVRRGGGLFVVAAGDVETSVLSAALEWQPPLSAAEHAGDAVVLSATDLRHPIFRPFGVLAANLGQVQFARAWRVDESGWDVAARFSDGAPALLERRAAEGRVVLFASDLDRRWNDFPLHPAFVPFAVESVRYLVGAPEHPREYLIAQAPSGVRAVPGPVRLPPDHRTVVLNVDSRESNPARISTAEFTAMLARAEQAPSAVAIARAQQDEARQSYWQYGLLLMLAVLVVESLVGRA
jgi:hypothetical protein